MQAVQPSRGKGLGGVLGATSGNGSDPAPSAEPVHVWSVLLWSTGGSCLLEEKLAMVPESQFMA